LDPEFTKLLFRVAIVGGAIGVIGTGVLLLAFQGFRRGSRGTMWVVALLAFVFLCCLVLLRVSVIR